MPFHTQLANCTVERPDQLGTLLSEFLTVRGAGTGSLHRGEALATLRAPAAKGRSERPGPRTGAARLCTAMRSGRWR